MSLEQPLERSRCRKIICQMNEAKPCLFLKKNVGRSQEGDGMINSSENFPLNNPPYNNNNNNDNKPERNQIVHHHDNE